MDEDDTVRRHVIAIAARPAGVVSAKGKPNAMRYRFERSSASTTDVTLLQIEIPAYRVQFVRMLRDALGGRLKVVAARPGFDAPADALDVMVRNHFLLGGRLLWQKGALAATRGAGVAVVDFNPRILSTWLILLVRGLLRRPTVIWGHAWPRSEVAKPSAERRHFLGTDIIRHLMRRAASAVLVYTETEARDLRLRMPNAIVEAAPNALYSVSMHRGLPDGSAQPAHNLLFVGRLIQEKKPEVLLEAFVQALDRLPPATGLVLVGDGPLRPDLEAVAAARAPGRVQFRGPLYEFEDLRNVYDGALASVIPGTAGLSLIQSLWFGVPSVVADAEAHGPEIEAAIEGFNATFFSSNSIDSLCEALVAVCEGAESWRARRHEIAGRCVRCYSLERMTEGFVHIVRTVTR